MRLFQVFETLRKSRQLDRSTVFHARSATDAVGVAIDFLSSPFLAASFMAACNFRYAWPLPVGRQINIVAAVARRTLGQIVFARMSVRTPCFAVSYVFQADCQSSLPIRLRSRLSDSERNPACRFLLASIKTSFGFRSKVGRTATAEFNYPRGYTGSGSVACSF